MRWPFVTRRERLRRDAADWIARLNGPHGEEDRVAFERWYGASPDHASAYDRLSALFQAAGNVTSEARGRVEPSGRAGASRSRPLRYAFAAAVACAALAAFFLLSARAISPLAETRQQFAAFSSDGPGSRGIVLADGSEVLLSPGSRLEVAIGRTERRLRLIRGEGRFGVALEARPFIVEASGAEVVARGTVFVVHVSGDRTTVSLIEGRVDVSYPQPPGRTGGRRVARLEPGERLVVEIAGERTAAPPAAAPAAVEARPRASPQAMLEFDDMPLGQAVDQMNHNGRPRVRLGDPALAGLRVTGAFRVGDTSGFAESVAAAFDLDLQRGPDASLWLRARSEARASN
jgi:transmembrane sensor